MLMWYTFETECVGIIAKTSLVSLWRSYISERCEEETDVQEVMYENDAIGC